MCGFKIEKHELCILYEKKSCGFLLFVYAFLPVLIQGIICLLHQHLGGVKVSWTLSFRMPRHTLVDIVLADPTRRDMLEPAA